METMLLWAIQLGAFTRSSRLTAWLFWAFLFEPSEQSKIAIPVETVFWRHQPVSNLEKSNRSSKDKKKRPEEASRIRRLSHYLRTLVSSCIIVGLYPLHARRNGRSRRKIQTEDLDGRSTSRTSKPGEDKSRCGASKLGASKIGKPIFGKDHPADTTIAEYC